MAIWLEAWDELDHQPREKTSVFLNLIHGRILPLATLFVTSRPWASEHLREKCEHRITQHVEVLTSAKDQIEHYITKAEAEAEAQPSSFAAKFTGYLSSNPVIRAAMHVHIRHSKDGSRSVQPEPTHRFTIYQQLKVTTFSDLPKDVY